MNRKQWIGVGVAVVGVLATGFAMNAMGRISDAKQGVNFFTKPFSGNPAGKAVGGELSEIASQYDSQVKMLLIGGIALILIGGGAVYFLRR